MDSVRDSQNNNLNNKNVMDRYCGVIMEIARDRNDFGQKADSGSSWRSHKILYRIVEQTLIVKLNCNFGASVLHSTQWVWPALYYLREYANHWRNLCNRLKRINGNYCKLHRILTEFSLIWSVPHRLRGERNWECSWNLSICVQFIACHA